MELPPLHDDRWHDLVRAVLSADVQVLDGVMTVAEERVPVAAQSESEEPSGRRSSTSS